MKVQVARMLCLPGLSTTTTVLGPFANANAAPVDPLNVARCASGQVIRGVHGDWGQIVDVVGFSCQELVLQ